MTRTMTARRLHDLISALQEFGYRPALDDIEITVNVPDRDAVLVESVEKDIEARGASLTKFGADYRAMIADHLTAVRH